MHFRTRNLLKLISDETTNAILEELRKGPRTEAELVESSPTDRKSTRGYLRDLTTLEVVGSEKSPPTGRPGPSPKLFSVTAPALLRFCDEADAFALALSEAQTKSLQQHVEGLPKN
jgi:DNA-binding IclR family transcriptional regulator